MKEQGLGQPVERKKVLAIGALFAISGAVTLLGLAFCVYAAVNQVEFVVFGARIPGVVFGVVTMFLGMRYYLAVQRLRREVYKSDARFSWSNFK